MEYVYILIAVGFWALGLLSFPLIMHLRLRKNHDYDDSNMTNTYRMIWVLTMRRILLSKLRDSKGNYPLAFVANDETENMGI